MILHKTQTTRKANIQKSKYPNQKSTLTKSTHTRELWFLVTEPCPAVPCYAYWFLRNPKGFKEPKWQGRGSWLCTPEIYPVWESVKSPKTLAGLWVKSLSSCYGLPVISQGTPFKSPGTYRGVRVRHLLYLAVKTVTRTKVQLPPGNQTHETDAGEKEAHNYTVKITTTIYHLSI